ILFYSISYTWLYNSTKGSLFTVSLYHASTNAANILNIQLNNTVFSVALCTLIILIVKKLF
ncbi:hypothetical protein KEJ21_03910, partial [Candidatus Bathyarchaeota archaeon]|nr:hypothetical protein [Candidatus Bathyarchaeota archaeon]